MSTRFLSRSVIAAILGVFALSAPVYANSISDELLNCSTQTWRVSMPDEAAAHTYTRSAQFNDISLAAGQGFDENGEPNFGTGSNGPFLSTAVRASVQGIQECTSNPDWCNDAAAAATVAGIEMVPNHCAADPSESLRQRREFFTKVSTIPGAKIDCASAEEAAEYAVLKTTFCGPVPAPRLSGSN